MNFSKAKIEIFQSHREVTNGPEPYSSYQIIIRIGLKIDFGLV